MNLSCCIWALSGPEVEAVTQVAEAGFEQVDLRPFAFQDQVSQDWLAASGMRVCCVAATHGTPAGVSPDSADGKTAALAIWMAQTTR